MTVLVLGIGNILLQDEGIGVRVVNEFKRRFTLPSEVTVVDGGTAGMALLDDLLAADRVIVVDAIKTGDPPATLVRFEGDQVPALLQQGITPHQLGLFDLLGALTFAGHRPPHLVLLGVVPASLELSLALSPVIEAKLDALVAAVVAELVGLGVDLHPQEEHLSLADTFPYS